MWILKLENTNSYFVSYSYQLGEANTTVNRDVAKKFATFDEAEFAAERFSGYVFMEGYYTFKPEKL